MKGNGSGPTDRSLQEGREKSISRKRESVRSTSLVKCAEVASSKTKRMKILFVGKLIRSQVGLRMVSHTSLTHWVKDRERNCCTWEGRGKNTWRKDLDNSLAHRSTYNFEDS